MKSSIKRVTTILVFLGLVLSYQNCSIYESDGRKLLEKEGTDPGQEIILNSLSANGESTCTPMLNYEDVERLFADDLFELKLFSDHLNPPSCLITKYYENSEESNSYVCTVSKNTSYFYNYNGTKYTDPHSTGPLANGSFGSLIDYETSTSLVRVVGIKTNSEYLISCHSLIKNEDINTNLDNLLLQLSNFVHSIDNN